MTPKIWHLYIVDLEPREKSKPGKQRPCICIQPTEFCESGLASAVIIPLTTKLQKEDTYPIRVRIPQGTCGLKEDSEALIEQILAWDLSFFKEELGPLPDGLKDVVKAAVKDFLDL
jgi:mRNA interferase MazF